LRRAALAVALMVAASRASGAGRDPSEAPGAPLPPGLSDEEKRDISVFRKASASVVYITNYATQVDLFSFNQVDRPQGTGSGFVWDKDGHIVTNYHVIEEGDRFLVSFSDQTEFEAKVVGAAPDKDLAVLEIHAPAERLVPLTLGRSSDLVVGQRVLAVGNPFGFDHTLTTGVISGLGRELNSPSGRRIHDVIQTDAAINPGNSGGPLMDSSGRLIGINAAIYSPSGGSAGIGFAVPVDTVARLVPLLIKHGRIRQPEVTGATLVPDYYASRLDYDGVAVAEVEAGSPADDAGLAGVSVTRTRRYRLGDIIVGVDGKPVHGQSDLLDAFEAAGIGATVKLKVIRGRGGEAREVRVTLRAGK
jgi:S1-C subfamily serine protease